MKLFLKLRVSVVSSGLLEYEKNDILPNPWRFVSIGGHSSVSVLEHPGSTQQPSPPIICTREVAMGTFLSLRVIIFLWDQSLYISLEFLGS